MGSQLAERRRISPNKIFWKKIPYLVKHFDLKYRIYLDIESIINR